MKVTERLRASIPQAVLYICQRLHEQGHAAWIVGGCVRDQLLAAMRSDKSFASPDDWDIATSARPEAVIRAFPKVAPTGIEHGTVTVLLNRTGYEVTTFRAEAEYRDGRRPGEVRFLDEIAADLARRDFTVNAIAYDPLTDTLADPFDGMADLRAGILRAVGDPTARFSEDGLRVLRAARFVATLAFELEPSTAAGISPSLASYRKVSAERIRDEWLKVMNAARPSLAFEVMKQHGLLDVTAPELMALDKLASRSEPLAVSSGTCAWSRTMRRVDSHLARSLRIGALLWELGPDTAATILRRLRFSNAEVTLISELVRHSAINYHAGWTDIDVRRWLQLVTPALVEEVWQLALADAAINDDPEQSGRVSELRDRGQQLLQAGAAMSVKDLALSGKDLIQELGLAPGPRIGALLGQLLNAVTASPELNTRNALLAAAREMQDERA